MDHLLSYVATTYDGKSVLLREAKAFAYGIQNAGYSTPINCGSAKCCYSIKNILVA
jgi:hypothetical protein